MHIRTLKGLVNPAGWMLQNKDCIKRQIVSKYCKQLHAHESDS